MSEDIYAKIERLDPKIRKMAQVYGQQTYYGTDDLYQQMVLTLIERSNTDPTFCQQTDSYILDCGRKYAFKPAQHRLAVENKYAASEPVLDDADDADDWFDTFASSEESPEAAYESLEQALAVAEILRSQLSGREQEVLSLVVKGVSTKEIASQFGVTPAAVSIYKSRIVAKVQAAL